MIVQQADRDAAARFVFLWNRDLAKDDDLVQAFARHRTEALSPLLADKERLEAALRNIAEGNLGDAPWEANYVRIREVAQAALSSIVEGGDK